MTCFSGYTVNSLSAVETGAEPIPKKSSPQVLHEQNDFYLRLIVGYGLPSGSLTYTDGNVTTIKNGSAALFSLHLGYTIFNNFIAFAEFGTTGNKNSKVLINSVDSGQELDKFNMIDIGLGVTWYLMPLNLYISPAIRFPQLLYDIYSIQRVKTEYLSKYGIGFGLSAGIELMVSETLATGLAINLSYDMPTPSNTGTIKNINQFYAGISATLTYN